MVFAVEIVSFPPGCMASRAFTARLRIADSSWTESASACHSPLAPAMSSVIVSPSVRRRKSESPFTSWLMLRGFGSSRSLRENASRCLVMSVAFSAPRMALLMTRRSRSAGASDNEAR